MLLQAGLSNLVVLFLSRYSHKMNEQKLELALSVGGPTQSNSDWDHRGGE